MGDAVVEGAATVPALPAEGERTIRAEFTGTAREYFRIWVVNLLLTFLTLGIYSAWAKVRKKRYFYGSTKLDGDSFDYFASPKAILYGRIVAAGVFVLYLFVGELYPMAALGAWLALAAILPWLAVRAFTFNARNSGYRGLRFDFLATTGHAVRAYVPLLLVLIATAGLAWPWFEARYKAYLLSHHAFGTSRFQCELPARRMFGIYFKGGLLALLLGVPSALLGGVFVMQADLPEPVRWLTFLLPLVPLYLAYAVAYAYVQARTTNLQWSNTRGPGVRFSSTLRATELMKLYVGNFLAVAATAGLLMPWAVVRTLRYRLENFAMVVEAPRLHEANPALARVGAAGQEVGDFFNLDLSI
jgi:uncharacterized membrane protein YjgN (DUF898 family)